MTARELSLATILVAGSWSAACAGESLEDAWRIALGADDRLQAARRQAEAAQDQRDAAKRCAFPELQQMYRRHF